MQLCACSRSYERYFASKVNSATYKVELEVVEVMISGEE
jgi:hypothetical protein